MEGNRMNGGGRETGRAEPEGIALLTDYRANPGKYLPLTDRQFSRFDEWEDEIVRNVSWGAGLLEGNRPYFAELWKVFGVATLTVTVSAENAGETEILLMIVKAGLVGCPDPRKTEIHFKETEDGEGNRFVSVNFRYSREDDDYAEQYIRWRAPLHPFGELNALNGGDTEGTGRD